MNLAVKIVAYIVRLDFLDGYRTYLSGFGSIVFGIALIALAAGNSPQGSVEAGIAAILAGVATIGHAGKLDKQRAAIEAAKPIS